MNDFNMTNIFWKRWDGLRKILAVSRECYTEHLMEHWSNQAAIAQKDYACYLAQEWAGARK